MPRSPKFVQEPKTVYTCSKCEEIAREPLQTLCGHHLCVTCCELINSSIAQEGPQLCPAAQDDCKYVTPESVNLDASAKREMGRLEVYCIFQEYGCKEKMPWKDLDTHASICDFATVSCPNQGCTETLCKAVINSHSEKDCKYRKIRCRECRELVCQGWKDKHLEEECPAVAIPCPYKCGEQAIKRKNLTRHRQKCQSKPLECKYKTLGCQFASSKTDLEAHYSLAVEQHLDFVARDATSLQESAVALEIKVHNSQEEETKLKTNIDRQTNELTSLVKVLDKHMKNTAKLESSLTATAQCVDEVIGSVKSMKDWYQERAKTQNKQVANVQEDIIRFDRQLKDLERNCLVTPGNKDRLGFVKDELDRQSRQLAMYDVCLADMDLHLSCLETADYSGLLIWKICDYRRRKRDAVSGAALSQYSQPFFTSRTGYKMCARVYLNGDGQGKDTHMSLFFSLMKGDYDELQTWPFTKQITLSLLDQCGGTRHLSDTFWPDSSSSSFQRPTTDRNVASGVPLFVAQSVVEEAPYLVNDTIFIQVKVATD